MAVCFSREARGGQAARNRRLSGAPSDGYQIGAIYRRAAIHAKGVDGGLFILGHRRSCSKETPQMRSGKSKSNNGAGAQPDVRIPNAQVKKELGVSYQTLRRWEAQTRKHVEQYGKPLEGDYPLPIWDHGR